MKCALCFSLFEPTSYPKVYCSRKCAARDNLKKSSAQDKKFIADIALFEEAERLLGPRAGRIRYIAKKLGCCEGEVHVLKRELNYAWKTTKVQDYKNPSYVARMWAQQTGCVICKETRVVDAAHLLAATRGGGRDKDNIVPLCPTHHRLYDHKKLNALELVELAKFLTDKFPVLKELGAGSDDPALTVELAQMHAGEICPRLVCPGLFTPEQV